MEDRWTALRWAIGTAQKKDCVVIAGKGHQDYQEWELEGKLQRVRIIINTPLFVVADKPASNLPERCS